MHRTRIILKIAWLLLALTLAATFEAQDRGRHGSEGKSDETTEKPASLHPTAPKAGAAGTPGLTAVIWRDPGDVAKLNLYYGSGGREHAPHSLYTFLEEDMNGFSPKFDVKDEHGVRWRVKLGEEPQAETAATRLLWAAGYFVDEDYYLPEIKVIGLPKKLHLIRERRWDWRRRDRQKKMVSVSADGTVRSVRLKRHKKEEKRVADWDWFDNPFVGSRELHGLRVMMALLNNWDLTSDNNAIREVGRERHYLVSDLGASFGKTGNFLHRSKNKLRDYVNSPFIEQVTPDSVDFVMRSRPPFFTKLARRYYRDHIQLEQVTRHIPRADARWLGERLSLLSDDQIRDSFRAAGYTPEEVEGYTKEVEKRIAALNAL